MTMPALVLEARPHTCWPPIPTPFCTGTYEGFFWAHCGWLMHSKV